MSGSGALTSGATGWYQLEAQFDTTSYNMHVLFKQLCAPMLRHEKSTRGRFEYLLAHR